jgi:hypothetical protein
MQVDITWVDRLQEERGTVRYDSPSLPSPRWIAAHPRVPAVLTNVSLFDTLLTMLGELREEEHKARQDRLDTAHRLNPYVTPDMEEKEATIRSLRNSALMQDWLALARAVGSINGQNAVDYLLYTYIPIKHEHFREEEPYLQVERDLGHIWDYRNAWDYVDVSFL